MEEKDLVKVIEFIQGAYNRTLSTEEIKVLQTELKGYDYQKFMDNLKFPLLKKVDYFTVQALHKIIQDDIDLQHLRDSLGIRRFEELYETECQTREADCENDPSFANLRCYLNVSYTVSTKGKMLLVTFYVDEFGGGAANHGYTETITYNPLTQTHSETKSDFY